MDDNRHGAGDAGQEVADPGAGQGTLHLAEIDGAGIPPGHPLQSDGFAVGLYGNNQAQEEEGRQQGPEGYAEVRRRLQPRPALRHADPGGVQYRREVKDAHSGGHNAAGHDADDRRPQAQGRGKAQRKAGDDDQRGQGRQRGGDGLGRRRIVQQAEDHRSQRDGEYHHHRAAYGGRYDAPEDEQPAGDDDLHHCGDDNQGGKGGRAAVGHRRDAEGDGEGGGEHRHGGAGAGRPQATHLQDGRQAHRQQGGKDHPNEVSVAQTRCLGDDDRSHQQGGGGDEAELGAGAQGAQQGRGFVRLVTGILRCGSRRGSPWLGAVAQMGGRWQGQPPM